MAEKELQIQMFGGFTMRYGGEGLAINKTGSSKSVRLLQMLLLSLDGGISKNELIDNLYGWSEKADMANRNRNLNNLLYRLKKQLISCGLPKEEYATICEGMCFFKTNVPIKQDTKLFELMVERARRADGGADRTRLLWQANEMYCGQLLPGNQSEMWFFQKSNYYKELYIWTIRELEKEFLEAKDYKNRFLLYSRAAAIYPFEHWQIHQIQCSLEMCRYEEALKIYNETMELYTREMGSAPAKELQECFEKTELLDENHRRDMQDIGNLKSMDRIFMGRRNDIRREIFGETHIKGAYYCAYPSFVDYCRMVVRAKERNRFRAVLMFLTLSRRGKKDGARQMNFQEQMDLLKDAIGDSLRSGDAYTRYGNRHFILMLMKTEAKACSGIFSRIEKVYEGKAGKGELWYYADMTQELGEAVLGQESRER